MESENVSHETQEQSQTNEQILVAMFPQAVNVNLLPETIELIRSVDLVLVQDKEIVISDAPGYITASDQLQKIKGLKSSLEDHRKTLTKPYDDKKTSIMNVFNPMKQKLDMVEGYFKKAILAFDEEQERQARIESAKKAEEQRKEQEKLMSRASSLAEKGKHEQADAIMDNAASMVISAPAPVVSAPIKAAGLSTRTTYSCEVVNMKELLQGVIDGKVPMNAIIPDQKFLDNQARAMKESFTGMYPGCKLVAEKGIAAKKKSPFTGG